MRKLSRSLEVFFLIILLTLSVEAEIVNEINRFDDIDVCEDYRNFLKGSSGRNQLECHPLADYLMASDGNGIRPHLRSIVDRWGEDSLLGASAATVWAVVLGDAILTYEWSELAGWRYAVRMTEVSDIERAVLYSHLLSEIQRLSVGRLCSEEFGCEEMRPLSSIGNIVGEEFANLDLVRADVVLFCLLTIDAFLIPVRDVLDSWKFANCVSGGKVNQQ